MSVVRLYIQSDSIAQTQVFPAWSGEVEEERADNEVYYRTSLGGDFVFKGVDYTTIKNAPDCEKIEIYLEEECNGTFVERWRGKFTTYDCKFNESICTATVRPYIVDDYECFLSQIDEEYVLNPGAEYTVKGMRGKYMAGGECCIDYVLEGDPIPTDPVCDIPDNWCFDKNTSFRIPSTNLIQVTSCFHRIIGIGTSTTPPTYGSDWQYITLSLWWRCPSQEEVILGVFANAYRFDDAIEYLSLQSQLEHECTFTVKSHFFGINNNHTAPPTNDAYTFAQEYLQDITIHQKSNVKRPDNDPAEQFVWKLTWKQLLDDLKVMFNVFWKFDGQNLIIEHISYFEATAGIDVTANNVIIDYGKPEQGAPAIEKFIWADDASFSIEHAGYPITYGNCGTGTKENKVQLFSNDIKYIRQVENAEEIADTGFCLVSCEIDDEGIYYVKEGNVALGWQMLHDKLHRHYRYFETGNINDEAATFLSVRKTRKLNEFNVNVCCDDAFDVSNYITTPVGNAVVKKATINYTAGGKNSRRVKIDSEI